MSAYMTDGQITKNFSVAECANTKAKEATKLILSPELIEFADMLQELRDWYRKPIKVNSWYRTKSFNSTVGGSPNSLHLYGLAMDWGVDHTDEQRAHVKEKWKSICAKHGIIGGINFYSHGYHLSVHEEYFGYSKFVFRDYRGSRLDW